MKLIFLRHGTAQAKSKTHSELDDFRRELVKSGEKEVKKLLKKNNAVFKDVDVIYSSPLSRAIMTAEILYKKFPAERFEMLYQLDNLFDPADFVKEIKEKSGNICFVGHEPFLTSAIKLLVRIPDLEIDLKKGGAVVLEGPSLEKLKLTGVIAP